ncbi:reverse transcriptase domain-containing protein [Tanacetum coccineum]
MFRSMVKWIVDDINITESERYPLDEYLHPYELSQRYQVDRNDVQYIDPYEKPEPIITEANASLDQNDQVDQTDQMDQDGPNDQNDHHITEPLSSPTKDTSAPIAVSSIQTESPSFIPSMASPSPQDRWSKDKHIKLVNIIGNPGAGMLIRAMAKELSDAPTHECLFVDFLSEEEPKKARLVAQGYNQQEGIDYDETFASVARLEKHKEAEDLAADHLFRFKSPHMEVLTEREIADKFSDEHLMELKSKFKDDEPCQDLLLGLCADNIMRRCVAGSETLKILAHCHSGPTGGHYSANVTAKKVYKAIKRILERSVGYNPKGWSEKLNDALWAFRTAYKTPTRCTPFRLVYRKAFHLPVEIEHKAHWALKQCNMDLTLASESRLMQLNELAELRDGAYENTRIYKERTKKWHDSRLCGDKDFKVGDKKYYEGDIDKEDDEVIEVLYKVEDITTSHVEYVKFWDDWEANRYGNANLGYRAAMVQLRAASPSTYNPLLPLEIPSPPLPLPSPDRRDAIPDADMLPRKRTCFTAPSHRFKIRESSVPAAARQTGLAMA